MKTHPGIRTTEFFFTNLAALIGFAALCVVSYVALKMPPGDGRAACIASLCGLAGGGTVGVHYVAVTYTKARTALKQSECPASVSPVETSP